MSRSRLQADFFARLAEPHLLRTMFDHLPNVYFFVKDKESRLMAASRAIFERLRIKSELEIIGARDEDLFPPQIARGYREDDLRVFRTGKPLLNRLEVWYDEKRNFEWCITTKIPLSDTEGTICGLMGMTRRDESQIPLPPESSVAPILDYLYRHTDHIVSVTTLAQACGVSERTLFRRINKGLGLTPYELMLRIRVQRAAEALLQTDESISAIAMAHGFCDQSTFTQHFHKRIGITPRQFRMRHGTQLPPAGYPGGGQPAIATRTGDEVADEYHQKMIE